MNQTQKHTPGKWTTENGWIADASGLESIARVVGKEGDGKLTDHDLANAEHIVRCVNSHDGLVEALRETIGLLEAWWKATGRPAHAGAWRELEAEYRRLLERAGEGCYGRLAETDE